MPRYYRLDSL